MGSATLISLSEYLRTSYRPDRDYVDGVLQERNVGEWDHSRMQALLLKQLFQYEEPLNVLAVPEQRVQVKATRFRVPDVCVVAGGSEEQIITRPPLIAIEVLSPEDSMSAIEERIDDYLSFGIADVWIFDPRRRRAYWADAAGVHEALDGVLEATGLPIRIDLSTLWP